MTDYSYMDPCGCVTDALGFKPCELHDPHLHTHRVHRLACAYAIADPVRAASDAERWRKQGHTVEADAVVAALRFWARTYKVGFGRAIEEDEVEEAA